MNHHIDHIRYLYRQYLRNALSGQELTEWQAILADPAYEAAVKLLMDQDYDSLDDENLESLLPERRNAIINQIFEHPGKITHKIQIRKYFRTAVAAAVATIVFGLGVFIYHHSQKEKTGSVVIINDIAPGKTGATLTLASGKKIRLTNAPDGELAKEAGVLISKTKDGLLVYEFTGSRGSKDGGQINTLSTGKGETYQIKLPDGSMVWLNSASSLSYAANLTESEKRRVRLQGEGFFEVAKDRAHPFVVETRNQEVEVLGTQFNINAYQDEPVIKTTLLEGLVSVEYQGDMKTIIHPDQQAILSGSGINVIPVVAEAYIDWKEGDINFRKEDLASIMRKVSRWYNVDIEYRDISNDDQTFTGYVSRTKNVSTVLEALSKISDLKFKIEGRKIIVSR